MYEPTIYQKLLAAKKDLGKLTKQAKANYGKYADIAGIIDHVEGTFLNHGLGFYHRSDVHDGVETISFIVFDEKTDIVLSTKCFHGFDGQKNTYQNMGAASTYLRRYTMLEGLGLAADDDDGDSLTKKPPSEKLTPLTLRQKNLMSKWTAMPKDAQAEAKKLKEKDLGDIKMGDMTVEQLDVVERIINSFIDIKTGEIKEVK